MIYIIEYKYDTKEFITSDVLWQFNMEDCQNLFVFHS
jgi:hypothetical protein